MNYTYEIQALAQRGIMIFHNFFKNLTDVYPPSHMFHNQNNYPLPPLGNDEANFNN
jgi:hypothetical protein